MIAIVFITAYSTAVLEGEGRNSVGVTADVTGGANGPNLHAGNLAQNSEDIAAFLGSYPSVAFTAQGEHSSLASTYGFGYQRDFTNPSYETKSHNAALAYSSKLGSKWAFSLSDTFYKTSNFSSFRLLSGTSTVPEQAAIDQFQFAFTPIFLQSNTNNTASVGLDRTFNKKSSMTISGSYSSLDYPNAPQTTGVLSDQQRLSANITFKKSGEHYSWTFGYSFARFNFAAFQNSLDHSAAIGYSYQFSPALSFQVNVGPSYLDSLENIKTPMGVNVTATLRRKIGKGAFALTASRTSGETSGLGSVSTNRELRLDGNHKFGRTTSLLVDVSAFDTQGLQTNPISARGFAGGGNLSFAFSRYWTLNWGGQYQHYEGYNTSGYDQKQIFMSIRYSNPELWRF